MNDSSPNNSPRETEDLLRHLEKQLDEISMQEMLKGMTTEALEAQGFIGDRRIPLRRAASAQATEKEGLVFEEGVEFERLNDVVKFPEIAPADVQRIRDTAKDALIATRKPDEKVRIDAGDNVVKKVEEGLERYYSTVKGKVLIIRDRLVVFPSDIDCTIAVTIAGDKMQAALDCSPPYGNGRKLTPEGVLVELRRRGVVFGIDEPAIAKAVEQANESTAALNGILVATGKRPARGADGRVEFAFDKDKDRREFTILPDGRIDYRSMDSIIAAKKGDLLATVIAPQPGTAGTDVTGQPLPAEPGTSVALTAGNGVEASPDGAKLFAAMAGQIVLNGPVIEVMNVHVVNGDVDYAVGNIDFNGNVVINGSVTEGFEVRADGDIIVAKNVDPARLIAGRDIIVKGGVMGRGKGLLSAGRDIMIQFAQNARLEAQGDIVIHRFAVNSYIFTSKSLVMQNDRGSVIGGEIYAQRGIDVKVLGSTNGTKTFVEAGTDFLVKRTIGELDASIEFCARNIAKMDAVLKPVMETLRTDPRAVKASAEVIKKSIAKRKELERRQRTMEAKRTQLMAELHEKDACLVKVSQICYPDVQIKIREQRMSVTRQHDNVRFYEDRKDGEIKTGPY